MRKTWINRIAVLLLVSVALSGCGFFGESESRVIKNGRVPYQVLEPHSVDFQKLYQDRNFKAWYDENSTVAGLHALAQGNQRYLLVSAGEKPTGGYSVDNLEIIGTESEIKVSAELKGPPSGALLTQTLTYPHILVQIPEDGRKLVFSGWSPKS